MKQNLFVIAILAGSVLLTGQQIRGQEAATPTTSEQTLEQRLAILERKYENDQEAVAAKAKDGAVVVSNKDGFFIKSNDGNFTLRIGGLVQIDFREYLGDHGSYQFNDQFIVRRARVILDGTVNKYINFRIVPDFANGGGTANNAVSVTVPGGLLPDAYLELAYFDFAKFRAGKFKSPVGLEQIQSDPYRLFNEASLATQLVPNRDTGVCLLGDFSGGAISYHAAILNGVADGSSGETDTSDGKEYIGRVFLQPFKSASSEWVNGFGAGISGSIGDQFGSATAGNSNLTSGYKTDGQQTFFTYQSGSFASGERKRISPQGYWYFSHVGLLAEYVASSQEVTRLTNTATVTNRAWQLEGSYVLTGERPSFNGVKPRKILDPKNHTWGAFEVAGRYAIFHADDEAFNKGFAVISASTGASAKQAKSWAAGINWYLNNNVRINSNYAVTSFVGGAASNQDRPTEKAILMRAQLSF